MGGAVLSGGGTWSVSRCCREGVETISDLYHRWTFFAAHNADIVTLQDGEWLLYSGTHDSVAGEIPLSANLGLVVRLDWASWLGVRGVPLPNEGTVDLRAGVNLVGFANLHPGVSHPSDLLNDIICAVIVTRRGELYLIGRVGDLGDEPLARGQAVILVATEADNFTTGIVHDGSGCIGPGLGC